MEAQWLRVVDEFSKELTELRAMVARGGEAFHASIEQSQKELLNWLMHPPPGIPPLKSVRTALKLWVNGGLVTEKQSMDVTSPWLLSHMKQQTDKRINTFQARHGAAGVASVSAIGPVVTDATRDAA
jgi:hypothetical protein